MRLRHRLPVLGVVLLLCCGGLLQVWGQKQKPKTDPEFTAFWIKFKAAVASNDKAAVADMTKLPFSLGDKNLDRAGYIKHYGSVFDAKTRRCIARAKPSRDREIMEIFCGEEIFVFEKVNGIYKFTEIGAND